MLKGARILITGPAGQVAFPAARTLARENQVFGIARFSKPADRQRLEAVGVTCIRVDMAVDPLAAVPEDVDYVLNFAVAKSANQDYDYDISANAEGMGRLMAHCRGARAVLHCSSTAVYAYAGHRPLKETDPLGDSHRRMRATYSLSKIAAEATVRFACRQWSIPTTIARLNVPFGDNGGWPGHHLEMILNGVAIPVHPEKPNLYAPIHEDDYVAHVPRLLEAATVPATIVNWGGSEPGSIEDWCGYIGELIGRPPAFNYTPEALGSIFPDLAKMHELLGETTTPWREGIRRMVKARHPELEPQRAP